MENDIDRNRTAANSEAVMNGGRYFMQRGWQDHPIFENDEYSRRDAWCWLIENACYKEHRQSINGQIVTLSRGQLSYSLGFLAGKWKWKRPRVQRFLGRLKTDSMIDTATDTGQQIITICNYDKFQSRKTPADTDGNTPADTVAIQRRIKDNNTPYGAGEKPANNNPAKNLFDVGVDYLVTKGTPESPARSFLAKLRKEHDDSEILSAIMKAQTSQIVEPKGWLTAYFKNRQAKAEYVGV